MNIGVAYVFSAIYLSLVVAATISINENDTTRRILRETVRRTSKLLLVLLVAGLIVQALTMFSRP